MGSSIVLGRRLSAVYDLVRPGSRVADIGADHGYLVCALVEGGKCPGGFACDIARQPLEKSAKAIARAGLAGQIQAVLTDGLNGLDPLSVEDIVIAGMGGEAIAAILQAAPWCRNPRYHLVLQPMTRAGHLRRWLCRNGFAIHSETPVAEGKFVYTVLSAGYTGEVFYPDKLFEAVGKIPGSPSLDAGKYLRLQRSRLSKQARGLAKTETGREEAASLSQVVDAIDMLIIRIGL